MKERRTSIPIAADFGRVAVEELEPRRLAILIGLGSHDEHVAGAISLDADDGAHCWQMSLRVASRSALVMVIGAPKRDA